MGNPHPLPRLRTPLLPQDPVDTDGPRRPPLSAWFAAPFAACWLPAARVTATFADARLGSRPTDPVLLGLAALGCGLLGAPMSFVEIGFAPLLVATLIAVWVVPRLYLLSILQPTTLLAIAWTLWQLASQFWTPDPTLWLWQFGTMRFALAMILLYPLLERRSLLIIAIAIAFGLQNLSQLITAVAAHEHWAVPWRTFPDRNAGWSVPVVGGTVLVGALGLHLPAAVMGQGRTRWIAMAGASISLLGVLATGTRGAWIGAAMLILIVGGVAIVRLPDHRARARATTLTAALVLGAGLIAWIAAGDAISRRTQLAWDEARAAIVDGNLDTDNGTRLLMAKLGWEAFQSHPFAGVGVGGFRAWAESHLREQGREIPPRLREHGHCHNTILQLLATTGVIGTLLFTTLVAAALRGAFSGLPMGGLGTYAAGPGFAIIGLLTVVPFDAVHVNAQSAALLYVLISLCAAKRPAERPARLASLRAITPSPNHPAEPRRAGGTAPGA